MKLISDWRKIATLSISFWSQIAGLLILIVPELIYMNTGIDTNPRFLWIVGVLLLLAGLIGRLLTQDLKPWVEWVRMFGLLIVIVALSLLFSEKVFAHQSCEADAKESAALDIAVPLIARWEGLRLDAYLDIVGVPTICYGSTRGIRLGMTMSKHQCDELLREEVAEYRSGWLDYVNSEAYKNWLPGKRDAAYTSLAYNVGIRAAGRSTATRRLNAGNISGGCQAIGWWNKAGGRVIRGLVNRRTDETNLCLNA